MAESEQHRIWGRYRIWSRYLQVGVKAPGTPNRMTFLPDAREWTETCWSLSSASKWARVPSGIFSPTAIGAIDSLSITGLMASVLLCWDRCCGAEMIFCALGLDLSEKRERDTGANVESYFRTPLWCFAEFNKMPWVRAVGLALCSMKI